MERIEYDNLGKVIKSARLDMKLTREQFAEIVSLSPRYIMSIENENKKPAYDKLCKIIRALGVNANDIFYPEKAKAETATVRLSRLLPQCDEREIKAITALVETLLIEKDI